MTSHPRRPADRAMRQLGNLALSLAGLAAAIAAIPATAFALPTASTFVQCFAAGNNAFHATDCNQGGFPGVWASAVASATMAPFPSATAEVTAPPAAVLGAGADANATYWFQVTGGNVGDIVPIIFDFTLSASATAESSALARLIIRSSGLASPHVEELVCDPQVCDETMFSDSVSIQARSGSAQDSVTLYALAQAPATGLTNESARAFADPYIYVDPAFPNASLYSIVVSPGVGNVPVPEPATAWLLGSALGAIGLARRKRV